MCRIGTENFVVKSILSIQWGNGGSIRRQYIRREYKANFIMRVIIAVLIPVATQYNLNTTL